MFEFGRARVVEARMEEEDAMGRSAKVLANPAVRDCEVETILGHGCY